LEVEDLLAGLSIPLTQLVALLLDLRGLLAILAGPLRQVRYHLLRLLSVLMGLRLPGSKVGHLYDEVVLGLLLSMKKPRFLLASLYQ
jgi:hypothetical protein